MTDAVSRRAARNEDMALCQLYGQAVARNCAMSAADLVATLVAEAALRFRRLSGA